MVHDELVIQAPAIYAEEVAKLAEDAIARAAAMKMTKVKMESEYHIADFWEK
jgi:DNA polymerase I-like protein with 3'-5' exonuclease and polymerase domains